VSLLENLRRAKSFLEDQQRVSGRALSRELGLDGAALDELIDELSIASSAGLHQCNARFSLLRVLAAQRAFEEWEREIERVEGLIDRIEGHRYFAPRLHEERARVAEIRGERVLWRRELGEAARLHESIGVDGHVGRLRAMLGDHSFETRGDV